MDDQTGADVRSGSTHALLRM